MKDLCLEQGDVLPLGNISYRDLKVGKKINLYGDDCFVIHNKKGLIGMLAEDSETEEIISIIASRIKGLPHELAVGTFNRIHVFDEQYDEFYKILEEVRSDN